MVSKWAQGATWFFFQEVPNRVRMIGFLQRMTAYCPECGFPASAVQCKACGAPIATSKASPAAENLSLLGTQLNFNDPDLDPAYAAYREKDYRRMVGYCLTHLDVGARPLGAQDGQQGWCFSWSSAAIYLRHDEQAKRLIIDAPIVEIAEHTRVQLMRALLELNGNLLGSVRFCLRGNLVALHFESDYECLPPTKLVKIIDQVACLAAQYDDALAINFETPIVGIEAQRASLDVRFIGKSRTLPIIARAIRAQPPLRAESDAEVQSRAMAANSNGPQPVSNRHYDEKDARLHETLAHTHQFCDVLHESLVVLRELAFSSANATPISLVARATLYRIRGEFLETLPAAVSYLLSGKEALLASVPPVRKKGWGPFAQTQDVGAVPSAGGLPVLFQTIFDAGGIVPNPGKEIRLASLRSVEEIRANIRNLLDHLDAGPQSLTFRGFVIYGAFHELRQRTTIKGPLGAHIDAAIEKHRGTYCTPQSLNYFQPIIEKLAG
jgi:hypothetical protein